mgnify:CR=1 FL=1
MRIVRSELVDIATEWNLKSVPVQIRKSSHIRRYSNRMEFKGLCRVCCTQRLIRRYSNRMEFKGQSP